MYGPHERPRDAHAGLREDLRHLVVHQVQLQQRRAAHPVDEHEHATVAGEVAVGEDRLHQHLRHLAGRSERHPAPARLAVDADSDLHLVVGQVERRLPGGRHRARGERHAHAAAGLVHPARHRGHAGEVATLVGGCAGELLDQHGDADAPPARRVEAVLHGDVVVRHHRDDLDAGVSGGELGGHLEVHDVAGVVLHDVQHAGAAVDAARRFEHLVGHRRGEHLARARGVEHAGSDEPAVQRLVPGPAAGQHARPCPVPGRPPGR